MARRASPQRKPLTAAQLANLAKGNPRVAERHAQGRYDDRLAQDSQDPVDDESLIYELLTELETDPELGERLAAALEPCLRPLLEQTGNTPRAEEPSRPAGGQAVLVEELIAELETDPSSAIAWRPPSSPT